MNLSTFILVMIPINLILHVAPFIPKVNAVKMKLSYDLPLSKQCTYKKTCVIKKDMGGDYMQYVYLLDRLGQYGTKVVVDGPCLSACTYLVEEYKKKGGDVCITKKAIYGIHAAKTEISVHGINIMWEHKRDYPELFNTLVKSKGGVPEFSKLKIIGYKDLATVHKTCGAKG